MIYRSSLGGRNASTTGRYRRLRTSPRIAIVHPHIANLQHQSRIRPDTNIRPPDAPPTHGAELNACYVSFSPLRLVSDIDTPAGESCRHHWIVDSEPHNSAFSAQCRHCDAQREFPVMSAGADFNESGLRFDELWSMDAAGVWPESPQPLPESIWEDDPQP
jgi:hypothetical protein